MRITTQRRVLAVLIACSVASSVSYAVSLPAFDLPEIGGIDLPSTAIAGDSVRMTIKATKDGTSACGLSIDFGDGTNQQFKVNVENTKMPISVDHAYKKPGKYTVKASGKKITTHHSCKGNSSAIITVSAPKKSGKASKPKK